MPPSISKSTSIHKDHKHPITGKPIPSSTTPSSTLTSQLSFTLLLFYSLLSALIYYQHHHLPSPLSIDAPVNLFSEDRAFVHLHALTSVSKELDGRITGSYANEVLASRYILETLIQIRTDAISRGWQMDIDIQRPSGSYNLDFLNGFTNVYTNVTNIVTRVYYIGDGNPMQREKHSFMLTAHFDSAIATQAASDDIINISNLLELCRVVTHNDKLRHAVLFHFTGSEETVLQSSHGFITKHRWAESIASFINIESAGGSERELVFQVGIGHSYLLDIYAQHSPHPFASSVGQDIFQSGLIPA